MEDKEKIIFLFLFLKIFVIIKLQCFFTRYDLRDTRYEIGGEEMKIGIIGMPLTGKTTLFNLLTGQRKEVSAFSTKGTKNIGIATVYDQRIEYLSSLYHPKKPLTLPLNLWTLVGFLPSYQQKKR